MVHVVYNKVKGAPLRYIFSFLMIWNWHFPWNFQCQCQHLEALHKRGTRAIFSSNLFRCFDRARQRKLHFHRNAFSLRIKWISSSRSGEDTTTWNRYLNFLLTWTSIKLQHLFLSRSGTTAYQPTNKEAMPNLGYTAQEGPILLLSKSMKILIQGL